MNEENIKKVDTVFENVMNEFKKVENIDLSICDFCKDHDFNNNIDINKIKEYLQYIDKKMLRFIYLSDTYIDSFSNNLERIKHLSHSFDNITDPDILDKKFLLKEIYNSEYQLINNTLYSNNEKIYHRSKSWIYSALACLNDKGFNKMVENDNWEELFVYSVLIIMIFDDILDIEEDIEYGQCNVFLFSKNIFNIFPHSVFEIKGLVDFVNMNISSKTSLYDVHKIKNVCIKTILEKVETKYKIQEIFDLLKMFVNE